MWLQARALAFGSVGALGEAGPVVRGASHERACGSSAGGGALVLRGRTPQTSFNVVFFYTVLYSILLLLMGGAPNM